MFLRVFLYCYIENLFLSGDLVTNLIFCFSKQEKYIFKIRIMNCHLCQKIILENAVMQTAIETWSLSVSLHLNRFFIFLIWASEHRNDLVEMEIRKQNSSEKTILSNLPFKIAF